MRLSSKFFLAGLFSFCCIYSYASEWNDSVRFEAEVGTSVGAGDYNPLWLSANQYGFSAIKSNSVWARVGAFKDLDKEKRFSWGAGVDMGVAYRFQSVFVPQQLYAEVKYRCLNAMIGAKELDDNFLDRSLSSGGLTNGWNSQPIPQFRAGIFDYADFWGCKGWFAVKGHIAYGTFSDNWWINRWVNKDAAEVPYSEYTLNSLYCSRAISFRFGNEKKYPLVGELGLCMETEFGGKTWFANRKNSDGTYGVWDKHPSDFKAWVKAFIPLGGSSDTDLGEQVNVQGNMLGNWSASLKWEDPRGWMVRLYYQHYYEDHSMLFFDYPWKDGLYGVQGRLPKNKFVSDIVYEFLYTKDQSGSVYWDHIPALDYQVSGADNYFNHYIYNGWQHWGRTNGNALITSPIYNQNHVIWHYSTRVMAHHLGFKGSPSPQVDYRVMLSHTRSWGSYAVPFRKVYGSFSGMAEANYHPRALRGFDVTLAVAFDKGEKMWLPGSTYYTGIGSNAAVMIKVGYSGFFKNKKLIPAIK